MEGYVKSRALFMVSSAKQKGEDKMAKSKCVGLWFVVMVTPNLCVGQAQVPAHEIRMDGSAKIDGYGISCLSVASSGCQLLAGTNGDSVCIIVCNPVRTTGCFRKTGNQAAFALSDEYFVASIWPDPGANVISMKTQKVEHRFTEVGSERFVLNRKLNLLAFTYVENKQFNKLSVYDMAKKKYLKQVKLNGNQFSVPSVAAISNEGTIGIKPLDWNKMLLWHAPYQKEPGEVNIGAWWDCLDFSPDGKQMAIGLSDGNLEIRDAEKGGLVKTLNIDAKRGTVKALEYSPDGKYLAVAMSAGEVVLFSAKKYEELTRVRAHVGGTHRLVFLADSLRFATASNNDSSVKVWSIGRKD
jgi:Anaphase-promoting complex subunit 4 WD40 domain